MTNIVLTGFMGTGKSSVGRRLAKDLGLKLIDTDSLIEEAAGKQVKDIFALYGEARFRELEKDVIAKLTNGAYGSGLVVSTGGGAVVDPENRKRLRAWGAVICLTASVDAILKRVGRNDERPLLSAPDKRAEIEKRLKQRQSAYADCDLTLDTTNIGIDAAGELIKAFLKTVNRE